MRTVVKAGNARQGIPLLCKCDAVRRRSHVTQCARADMLKEKRDAHRPRLLIQIPGP